MNLKYGFPSLPEICCTSCNVQARTAEFVAVEWKVTLSAMSPICAEKNRERRESETCDDQSRINCRNSGLVQQGCGKQRQANQWKDACTHQAHGRATHKDETGPEAVLERKPEFDCNHRLGIHGLYV